VAGARPGFEDAVAQRELQLAILCNVEISKGVVATALDNCLAQVMPHLLSKEIQLAIKSVIMSCKDTAMLKAKKDAHKMISHLQSAKTDLQDLDVPSEMIHKLDAKIADLQNLQQEDSYCSRDSLATQELRDFSPVQRSSQDLDESLKSISKAMAQLRKFLVSKQVTRNPKVLTALNSELYALACMEDCCKALALGRQDMLTNCAEELQNALTEMIKDSKMPHVHEAQKQVISANKDLHYAQKQKTIESLEKAKSENRISGKKLETLTQLIGY